MLSFMVSTPFNAIMQTKGLLASGKAAQNLSLPRAGRSSTDADLAKARLPWELHPSRISIVKLPNKQLHKLGSGELRP